MTHGALACPAGVQPLKLQVNLVHVVVSEQRDSTIRAALVELEGGEELCAERA